MQTINNTDARNRLAELIDKASRHRKPIMITRKGAGTVVLLAVEEYESMEAELHLFSTRSDTRQIEQSLDDFASGNIQAASLVVP